MISTKDTKVSELMNFLLKCYNDAMNDFKQCETEPEKKAFINWNFYARCSKEQYQEYMNDIKEECYKVDDIDEFDMKIRTDHLNYVIKEGNMIKSNLRNQLIKGLLSRGTPMKDALKIVNRMFKHKELVEYKPIRQNDNFDLSL